MTHMQSDVTYHTSSKWNDTFRWFLDEVSLIMCACIEFLNHSSSSDVSQFASPTNIQENLTPVLCAALGHLFTGRPNNTGSHLCFSISVSSMAPGRISRAELSCFGAFTNVKAPGSTNISWECCWKSSLHVKNRDNKFMEYYTRNNIILCFVLAKRLWHKHHTGATNFKNITYIASPWHYI